MILLGRHRPVFCVNENYGRCLLGQMYIIAYYYLSPIINPSTNAYLLHDSICQLFLLHLDYL